MINENNKGTGAKHDEVDSRDRSYDIVAAMSEPMTDDEWAKGYDIEKELKIEIPIKDQGKGLSCVGQAFSYYSAVKNTVETGKYEEQSAKGIYSQICLPGGGAYFRDGAKTLVDFGAITEAILPSCRPNNTTDEEWMTDKSWITEEMARIAKILGAKEYRNVTGITMDIFAQAVRDNHGIVAGVEGVNNGTWMTNEPKPPVTGSEWSHALYYGKFGIDELGKFIATPNSWGKRVKDKLHPDGWQKIRQDYFVNQGRWIFSPWTIIDKPNFEIKDINMVMIKLTGSSTVYAPVGDVLIPFATNWETFQKDFGTAKLVELNIKEFSKFAVAKAVEIKAK